MEIVSVLWNHICFFISLSINRIIFWNSKELWQCDNKYNFKSQVLLWAPLYTFRSFNRVMHFQVHLKEYFLNSSVSVDVVWESTVWPASIRSWRCFHKTYHWNQCLKNYLRGAIHFFNDMTLKWFEVLHWLMSLYFSYYICPFSQTCLFSEDREVQLCSSPCSFWFSPDVACLVSWLSYLLIASALLSHFHFHICTQHSWPSSLQKCAPKTCCLYSDFPLS